MTKNQAVELAKKLTGEGVSQRGISKKLFEAGYATKTGKDVGQSGVSALLRGAIKKRAMVHAAHPRKKAPAPVRATRSRVDAIKSILKLKGMSADEKVALALLVID